MPLQPRAVSGGDPHAAGRARQRLKLAAIGYVGSRHGVDADPDLSRAALALLCQIAHEFVESLGTMRKKRRDREGHIEPLKLAAIAYASARHGIDADVGMSREGLALLCQGAISYVESLPDEEVAPKRTADPRFQIGTGMQR